MNGSPPLSEEETALFREAYRALQEADSRECPGEEALAALVLGEVEDGERERLADHVVRCRRCAGEWRLLRQVHEEASRSLREEERRPLRRPLLRLASLAAGLAAIGLGALLFLQPEFGALPELEPRADQTHRGAESPPGEAVAPPDGGSLAAPPGSLGWPAQEGAEGYTATLFDASAERLWRSERSEETEVRLPKAVRSRLQAGRSYLWSVEVHGAAPRRLGPFWFTLEAEPASGE